MPGRRIPRIAFGAVAGALYMVFGMLEAVAAAGVLFPEHLFIGGDPMGSFILIVVGATFLWGAWEIQQGMDEGMSYIYVGIVLALAFAMIYALVMGANAVEAGPLGNEDLDGWTASDDVRPGLYLAVLPLFGMMAWRDRFRLSGLTKAGK